MQSRRCIEELNDQISIIIFDDTADLLYDKV